MVLFILPSVEDSMILRLHANNSKKSSNFSLFMPELENNLHFCSKKSSNCSARKLFFVNMNSKYIFMWCKTGHFTKGKLLYFNPFFHCETNWNLRKNIKLHSLATVNFLQRRYKSCYYNTQLYQM